MSLSWFQIFAEKSPTDDFPELVDDKHIPLLKIAIWLNFLGALLFMAVFLISPQDYQWRIYACAGLAALAVTAHEVLRRWGAIPTVRLLAIGTWTLVTMTGFIAEGVRTPVLIAYPIILIFGGWLLGERTCVGLFVASCVALIAMATSQQAGLIGTSKPVPPVLVTLAYMILLSISVVMTLYLLRLFRERYTEERRLNSEINQNLQALKKHESQLRLAAAAFESQEGMMITDASNVIVQVNRAFTEMSGYTAEEVIGRTPTFLRSGRHAASFFVEIWESVKNTGAWQGEIWDRRKNGEIHPKWLTITALKLDDGNVTHYVSTHTDITQRKLAEEEITHLAFYDPLTQLPNRRLLLDRLQQALASSARSGLNGALLFLDLDNFKLLNDTLGHDKGDLLLQQVARRLVSCVREGDTVARLGGDEFVVMLEGLSENAVEAATQAEIMGEKILADLNLPYQLNGLENHSTPSIGVTLLCGHRHAIEELLKQADLAMYQAKTAGRNTLRFFDPKMQAVVADRASLEVELRAAVRQRQFILYYQAQVVGNGHLTGAEALVRWQHPQRGLMSPAHFIPLAEETGLILPLGLWVLETACAQLAKWADQPNTAHFTLAVNISANQLHQADFVDQVLGVLSKTGANPRKLKLELTESLLVSDVESSIAKMAALKAHGVGFSMDDFGTGYSSLTYLKRLPLDQLKIDQSFVRDILTENNDAAIAKMILALAESLGLKVIAEGVEIETQKDFLAHLGCLAYQGFLFGHPLPLDEFEAFIRRS
jgi:diguanylate cyclase (GGDEF)-like protein/PAS domain S-box-containing protein